MILKFFELGSVKFQIITQKTKLLNIFNVSNQHVHTHLQEVTLILNSKALRENTTPNWLVQSRQHY